jgi:hypothetical protein
MRGSGTGRVHRFACVGKHPLHALPAGDALRFLRRVEEHPGKPQLTAMLPALLRALEMIASSATPYGATFQHSQRSRRIASPNTDAFQPNPTFKFSRHRSFLKPASSSPRERPAPHEQR